MASQTKVEPVDGADAQASTSNGAESSRVTDSVGGGSDAAGPASGTGSLAPGQGNVGDDEDVSLDELMMSDSNEGDEPDDSTDVRAAFPVEAALDVPNVDSAPAGAVFDPFTGNRIEEDEAAALAAAAAAQEAAAQAAAEEADARMSAARRGSDAPTVEASPAIEEVPRPRRASSAPPAPAEPVSFADAPDPEEDASAADTAVPPPASVASRAPPESEGEPPPSDDQDPPMSVEPEPPSVQFDSPLDADVREADAPASAPAAAAAPVPRRRDAPLPSFDIPEAEGGRRRAEDKASNRVTPRPLATPLSHLSEASEEDDDDAVTHIGLPVVPEAPEYSEPQRGFAVADAGVAALRGFEPDLSLSDARRATTRVVQRIDTAQLEMRRAASDTYPALSSTGLRRESLGTWLSGLVRRVRPQFPQAEAELLPPARRRSAWLLDTVLPPLSLVLLGSGIGAGIMLLQPNRGAKAAQQAQTIQALKESPKHPTTLAERAEAGEGDALFKITNMPANDRSSELTLALERGYQAQKQNEFKEFSKLLDAPGGLATPNLTTRFLNFATSPETMLAAFSDLLTWPGSTGPDVLYAVWEKAPGGNRAASLAQQLLHSADQRSKATPALITALDLRSATTCEDYLRVLPSVQRDGDQRCSATLRALKHTDGCGDDGQKDCFACLRDGSLLEDSLSAIEGRVPPQL